MRLLGLIHGRHLGNCEIVAKEALMSAETTGLVDEIELIRLNELNIKGCTGCDTCMIRSKDGGEPECVSTNDDMVWLMDRVAEADGVILASAIYFLTPPGPLKTISDRMLPYSVKTVRRVKANIAAGVDVRKVAGVIAVGGGPHHWAAMGSTLLLRFTTPLMMDVVDKLHVYQVPGKGQVLLREDFIERARKVGRNVAVSLGKRHEEIKFLGDDPGACPVCHSDLLYPGKRYMVECGECGAGGRIEVTGDTFKFIVDDDSLHECHLTLEGRDLHVREIWQYQQEYFKMLGEIRPKFEKYRSYGTFIAPDSREPAI